jgi:hypothetical protein
MSTGRKSSLPLTAVTFLLAAGALALTGCQSASALNRTVDVTPVPDPVTGVASDRSAGMELHFGHATFGLTCATDSAGDGTRGTAALMCTWRTDPR